MSNYQPGQKVRVIRNTSYADNNAAVNEMVGKVCTIRGFANDDYYEVWEPGMGDTFYYLRESDLEAVNDDKPNICKRCGEDHAIKNKVSATISKHFWELFPDKQSNSTEIEGIKNQPPSQQADELNLSDLLWQVKDRDISVNAAVEHINQLFDRQLAERLQAARERIANWRGDPTVDPWVIADNELQNEIARLMPNEASHDT